MKARDAALDLIAMARTVKRYDPEAFTLLMPDNLEDALRMLTMAAQVIDHITAGPNQDKVLELHAAYLAEKLGDTDMP